MKKTLFSLFIFLLPVGFAGAVSPNTGFVADEIWFSEEKIKDGDTVKIYTAIFNGEDEAVKFSVNFLNSQTVLSKKDVTISSGETKTVSADFKAVLGHHELYAEISKSTKDGEDIILDLNKTKETKISIVKDVPAEVAKTAITASLSQALSSGSFDKIGFWFDEHFKKSEEFRDKKLEDFKKEKEDISKKRADNKDSKTQTKVLMFLHFSLFALLVFIFSIQFVFYAVVVVISYVLVRWVFRIIVRIFRKRHEE
jgi:hypothetical protein